MLSDLASMKLLLAVTIADPTHLQQLSHYIICGPCTRPDILAGHWTWMSVTYDVQRKKHVLLKDSWQVLLDSVTPEGEIYAKLHQNSVPNIPFCLCTGDVGDNTHHKSWMHKFVGACGGHMQLMPHWHYCLVLDTISWKLEMLCYH